MNKILIVILMLISTTAAAWTYEIDYASSSRIVIDGKTFEPKTYCSGRWDDGDKVVFSNGRPSSCTDITIHNKNSRRSCEVWCK